MSPDSLTDDHAVSIQEVVGQKQALVQTRQKRNQRLPREIREQQIQAAALKVFRKKGYQGGLISDIAKEAGLAEGALYKFYRSKKEILEAVVATWYDATLRDYEIALAAISDPYERLRFAITHNLRCLCQDVAFTNLYFELRRDHAFRSSKLVDFNKRYIGLMKSIIMEIQAQKRGATQGIRPSLMVEMIYSMVETKSERYRFGERNIDEEAVVSQIYELALRVI